MLLFVILLQSKYGGILDEDLGLRWVCLGFDENFVFQGHHNGVISHSNLKLFLFLLMWHIHQQLKTFGFQNFNKFCKLN
jgi:hypothetical protein